jgi:uncharacterized repeat protein (TIGR01451 family)
MITEFNEVQKSMQFRRTKMNSAVSIISRRLRPVHGSLSLVSFASLAALMATPANAAIDNTATASGSYGATTTTSSGSSVSVPVAPASGSLSIAKSAAAPSVAAGADATITDGGDTITYTYIVTNNGNVTMSGVTPVDAGPTFGGSPGTGSMGSFTLTAGTLPLAPGQAATFEADYTLSTLDVFRAAGVSGAVANSATATGTTPGGATVTSPPGTASTTITAGPLLTITKAFVLDDSNGTVANQAEVGEIVTYTYTILNSGNVALTNVAVNDTHEGAVLASSSFSNETLASDGPLAPTLTSTDTTANDGVWSTLQPGATITIQYVHTVTQTEVDNQ